MLRYVAGILAGSLGAASLAHPTSDEAAYQLLAATVDGRVTMAIVDAQGIAVALELDEDRGQIVQGLAAGAILSDLREVLGAPADQVRTVASGAAASQVSIDGKILMERASISQTKAAIDALPQLSLSQKSQLQALLGLE